MAHYEGKRYGCSCTDGTCDMNCRMYRIAAGKPSNADRIRAMSDEELDRFLNEVQGDAYLVGFHASAESRFTPYGRRWLEWLKQEANDAN